MCPGWPEFRLEIEVSLQDPTCKWRATFAGVLCLQKGRVNIWCKPVNERLLADCTSHAELAWHDLDWKELAYVFGTCANLMHVERSDDKRLIFVFLKLPGHLEKFKAKLLAGLIF